MKGREVHQADFSTFPALSYCIAMRQCGCIIKSKRIFHILCCTYEISHYLGVIVPFGFILILYYSNSGPIRTEGEKRAEINP